MAVTSQLSGHVCCDTQGDLVHVIVWHVPGRVTAEQAEYARAEQFTI